MVVTEKLFYLMIICDVFTNVVLLCFVYKCHREILVMHVTSINAPNYRPTSDTHDEAF